MPPGQYGPELVIPNVALRLRVRREITAFTPPCKGKLRLKEEA
jgi:hypothetical protein